MSRNSDGPRRVIAVGRGVFRAFYDRQFLPAAVDRLKPGHVRSYDQAVATFLDFAGGGIRLADVDDELLAAFVAACDLAGRSAKHRRTLAGLVRQVVLAWNPEAVRKPRHRIEAAPPAARGTVLDYFERVYAVEAMVGARPASIENTRVTLRALNEFAGDAVQLTEQDDRLAADFLRWLLDCGLTEATVNRYRRTWFAVWRHAFDRNLVKRPPRVKRLKEIRNPPDSWSRTELQQLVGAALGYRKSELYGDVRVHLWWHAVFLVAYYTALRFGSLMAIRRDDIDLKTGLLYVPGGNMKNRQGQMFQLGADAIAAVELIWLPPRLLLFATDCSKWTINKHFGELLAAAGIGPGRRKGLSKFHKLRRTVATEIAARASTAAASSLLGHSSSYVTARYIDPSKLPGHDVTKILPPLAAG